MYFHFSYCVLHFCLFFSSSRSLLNISCIFSICASIQFPRFWIIFIVIILNSFSGRLPTYSSFISSGGFLSCSFIYIFFVISFFFLMGETVFLSYWLFGLKLPAAEFAGSWVELGLGAKMRNYRRSYSDWYSLGSEVLLVQWFGLGALTTGAWAQPLVHEARSCKCYCEAKKKKTEQNNNKK